MPSFSSSYNFPENKIFIIKNVPVVCNICIQYLCLHKLTCTIYLKILFLSIWDFPNLFYTSYSKNRDTCNLPGQIKKALIPLVTVLVGTCQNFSTMTYVVILVLRYK